MNFSLVPVALAQQTATLTQLESLNLADVVYLFVALAIMAAGALSIVFIFFGGFSFILSGGAEDKVKQAIHTIRYAIIGLIISLLSLVIVPFVGRLFNVNFDFFDFRTLSSKINILFSQFRESSTPVGDEDQSVTSSQPTDRGQPANTSLDMLIR